MYLTFNSIYNLFQGYYNESIEQSITPPSSEEATTPEENYRDLFAPSFRLLYEKNGTIYQIKFI